MTDEPLLEEPEGPGRLREMYESERAARAQTQAELDQLRSRELFRDAGFDLGSPQHQAFQRGYDGDLNPEGISAYAQTLGIGQAPPAPAPEAVPIGEQEALLRIAEAARDSNTVPVEPDRALQLQRQMDDRARHGATKQELDDLSIEYSRARGFRTTRDLPGY